MILPLEKQLVSLESSKRLKELGCAQDSLFYWVMFGGQFQLFLSMPHGLTCQINEKVHSDPLIYSKNGEVRLYKRKLEEYEYYPAYTSAELGEMLPIDTATWKTGDKVIPYLCGSLYGGHKEDGNCQVESMAKFLIHLLENQLTTPERMRDEDKG